MAKNMQKRKIEQVRKKVKERLKTIVSLKKEVSALKKAEEELDWMLQAEENAPPVAVLHASENLLHNLNEFDSFLIKYSLPKLSSDSSSFINFSGTVSSSDYINQVYKVRDAYENNNEVQVWATKVTDSYFTLRRNQARTVSVTNHLGKLSDRLKELHESAIKACLSTSSGVQSPIEGAALVRELLDNFKGELIRKCKDGKGASYQRIADNLARDDLKAMISNQQDVYDNVHRELSETLKSRIITPQTRVQEILSTVEDHILIVIIALEPTKVGVEFGI